jgi:DNA recombination protein RmuC
MDNIILLASIVGFVLVCTLIIIWQIKSLHVEQKEFLYEKINQIEQKLLDNSKSTTTQIEKNAELFIKISNSQQLMRNEQQKSLYEMSKEIQTQSSKDIEKLTKKVEENLQNINEKVEKRLTKGFENIDKTFKDIIVGIAKIGEAQKKIESLSSEVNSLQSVLTDKKSRGIFGEVQLNSILNSIFGDKKDLYDLQYSFDSGVIADAIIKAPEPLGIIAIDSKFPMENYTRMVEDDSFKSSFKQNIKKHINDISSKYIIKGKTADMAILFLPAEAIFAEINAYHEELIEYGRKRGVWIASPTTLMALLTTITAIVRDIKTQEQAKKIQEELMKLSSNFKLYKKRWDNLSKHIDTVSKDVKEITTSTNKISSEFERIERVEFDEKPLVDTIE